MSINTRQFVRGFAAFVLAFGALGCGSEAPVAAPEDTLEYELHPWTTELSAQALAGLERPEAGMGTLRFVGAGPEVTERQPGDVIVAGQSSSTPKGLLRVVVATETQGDTTTLDTLPVPLPLAFRRLHAKLERPALDFASDSKQHPGTNTQVYSSSSKVGGSRVFDVEVYNLDQDPKTKDDQFLVHAEISGQISYGAQIDLDWLDDPTGLDKATDCLEDFVTDPTSLFDDCISIPDVRVKFEASMGGDALLEVDGASSKNYVSPLLYLNDTPWQLPEFVVGPVVLTPQLDFTAQVSGDAATYFQARTELGFNVSVSAQAGLTSGVSAPKPKFEKRMAQPSVQVSSTGHSKASFGPRLSLLAYDSFGFYADLHAFGELDADQARTPCWDYRMGLSLSPGVRLQVPWKKFGMQGFAKKLGLDGDVAAHKFGSVDLYDAHPFEDAGAAARSCSKPPESALPLGEGPSSATYLDPTFSSWSQRVGNVAAEQPYVAQPGQSRIQIEKSHDTSWLISGSFLGAVSKVTDAGTIPWTRRLNVGLMDDEIPISAEGYARSVLAVPSQDMNILLAADRFTLASLDQSGNLNFARRLRTTDGHKEHSLRELLPVSLVSLADGGYGALYTNRDVSGVGTLVLLRLTAGAQVVFAKELRFPTGQTSIGGTLVPLGNDLIVTGYGYAPESTEAYVVRVTQAGQISWAKQLIACAESRVRIEDATLRASGDLALVGTHGIGSESAFFATISPTGEPRTARGFATGSAMEDLSAVGLAELPTSGFVTLSRFTPNKFGNALELATHDSLGQRTAAVRYSLLHENGIDPADLMPAGLRLTTDGGALIVAHVRGDQSALDTGLWISKLPARTFDAAFHDKQVQVDAGVTGGQACTLATNSASIHSEDIFFDAIDVTAIASATPLQATSASTLK